MSIVLAGIMSFGYVTLFFQSHALGWGIIGKIGFPACLDPPGPPPGLEMEEYPPRFSHAIQGHLIYSMSYRQ